MPAPAALTGRHPDPSADDRRIGFRWWRGDSGRPTDVLSGGSREGACEPRRGQRPSAPRPEAPACTLRPAAAGGQCPVPFRVGRGGRRMEQTSPASALPCAPCAPNAACLPQTLAFFCPPPLNLAPTRQLGKSVSRPRAPDPPTWAANSGRRFLATLCRQAGGCPRTARSGSGRRGRMCDGEPRAGRGGRPGVPVPD